MAPLVIFVNDAVHARRHLGLLLQGSGSVPCTVVLCPPRLPRRIGKWLSGSQRDHWQRAWADRLKQALALDLQHEVGPHIDWLMGGTNPSETAVRLRRRLGGSLRIVDARIARFGQALGALQADQAGLRGRWKAPAAVTSSLSLVLALAD